MHNTWHCGTVAPWHHGTWHSQRHASQASIFLALPLSIDALGHFRRSQKAAMAATAAKGELRQMRTHKDKAGHTSQCMFTHTHIYIHIYLHTYVCSRNIDTTCSDSHPDDPTKRIVAPYWQSKRRAKLSLTGRRKRSQSRCAWSLLFSCFSFSFLFFFYALLFNLILPILKRFAPCHSTTK